MPFGFILVCELDHFQPCILLTNPQILTVYRSPVGDGFSRDGPGRQSMSEKRKGHGDPRSSEIYQKVRGLKELHKGRLLTCTCKLVDDMP